MSMNKKLINCDLGECLIPNPDAQIMPLIDMANIACGGHIGDDESMLKTIRLAKKSKVKIGAHPSYLDRDNFGRISHQLNDKALFDLIFQQVSRLQKLCHNSNVALEYVKPHGALYHDMMENPRVFNTLINAVQAVDKNLNLVVQAGMKKQDKNININLLHEVFADRGYQGINMIARSETGAVLSDVDAIVKQYQHFASDNTFKIDTICFHSDNPASVKALKRLKNA